MWKINPSEITHTPKDGFRNVKEVEREGCFMTHSWEWWLAGGSRHLPGSCHKSVVSCCISLIASICKYVWSMRRMGGSVYLCRSRWNICIILNIAACFPRSLPMAFICSFLDDFCVSFMTVQVKWENLLCSFSLGLDVLLWNSMKSYWNLHRISSSCITMTCLLPFSFKGVGFP